MKQVIELLVIGESVLLALFSLMWVIQLKTKNAGIVDVVWSASFPLLGLIYFINVDGYLPRQLLVIATVAIWGLRLASYLFIRTVGHGEDIRYTTLRKSWGEKQNIKMLRFFIFQAILAVALSLPFAQIMVNSDPGIKWVEFLGAGVWFVGVIGESAADYQLKRFKANTSNKGKICQTGLWFYSRHPNYFFEWLIWMAYFIIALGSPWGFLSIICPLSILYFLLNVTGIPYTETQMIKSRGQAYIDYQKTTSSFIPLPKKHVV